MSIDDIYSSTLRDLGYELHDDYHESVEPIYQLVQLLKDENIDRILQDYFKDYRKIGVFGPYQGANARQIITDICTYIARKGFVVFTGYGYHHPSLPAVYHSLDTILTPTLQATFKNPVNEEFLYSYFIPSIIEKAVSRVAPIRTHFLELRGCERFNVPVLGFANDPVVTPVQNECDWVDVLVRGQDVIKKCSCNHILSCPVDHNRQTHCIFYTPHLVPRVVKTRFLNMHWSYYSLNNYNLVYPLIDAFL